MRWLAAQALARCGLDGSDGVAGAAPEPLRQIGERLGVAPELDYALVWLLEEAAALGAVEIGSSPAGARVYAPGRPATAAAGEAIARDLARYRDLVGSSLPLFDHVAACYPDVLAGRRSGQLALLRGAALQLLESYFSAANPLYDVHNQLAWTGLREALERLGRPARVLELGVGTGGGTAAGLAGLPGAGRAPGGASLTLSDTSPSFAVNTARRLAGLAPPGVALQTRRLDFTQPLLAQGVEAGSFDVLIGVNAVHNGGDLGATLGALRGALAADGWLVISESLCGAGCRVHQELIFNLLPLPRREESGVASRFFSATTWRAGLGGGGWRAEVHVNREGPELAMLALAQG